MPSEQENALGVIAAALGLARAKKNAPRLVDQVGAVTEEIRNREESPNEMNFLILKQISRTLASFGDLREARRTVQGLPINERALALAGILQGWAEGHSVAPRSAYE